MHNLAKQKTNFLQDIPFISIWFIINTSKCTILQKRKRLFLQDFPFISICFNNNTSKCKVLPKGKRLFCKIFHLLVYVSLLILVNLLCCKIFHIPYFSWVCLTGIIGIATTRVLFGTDSAIRVSSVHEQHQNRPYSVYCLDIFKTWGTTCSNEIFH